jgi:hypothetical protein
MEKHNLIGSLLKFGTEEVMSEVCEACQLGKQGKHPFPTQTTHVNSKPLEMIHSDMWCRNPTLGPSVRMQLTLPKVGKWSPPGLLKTQKMI